MITCRPFLCLVILFTSLWISAQERDLDPSIFDGSDIETTDQEAPQPGGPEQESGDTTSEAPSATSEPGTPPRADIPAEEELSAEESGAGRVSDETDDEAGLEAEGHSESPEAESEEDEEVVEPAGPGSPAPSAQQSRAGEQVETRDRIAPGQAVDLPWDL